MTQTTRKSSRTQLLEAMQQDDVPTPPTQVVKVFKEAREILRDRGWFGGGGIDESTKKQAWYTLLDNGCRESLGSRGTSGYATGRGSIQDACGRGQGEETGWLSQFPVSASGLER